MPDAPLREIVLLFPIAVAMHIAEEWPSFPRWARRWASPRYSDREYVVTHALALFAAVAAAVVLHFCAQRWMVFGFIALIIGPAALCNAIFHFGASLATRTYCPGAVTGLVFYIPLSIMVLGNAVTSGRISGASLTLALAIAALVHTVEVGHTVFKRW